MRQRPFTHMDKDSAPDSMPQGHYRHAENCRVYRGGQAGSDQNGFAVGNDRDVLNTLGNVEVENPLLLSNGVNKTIGTLEDKRDNTIIYFVYNSLGGHTIFRFYPTRADDRIEKIVEFDFGWTEFDRIENARLVDDMLFWHTIGGKPQKVDIVKANDTNKTFILDVYFNDPTTIYNSGEAFTFDYTLPLGSPQSVGVYGPAADVSFGVFLKNFVIAFNANAALNDFEASENGNYITITSSATKAMNMGGNPSVLWSVLQNTFPENLDAMFFEVIKYPPHFPVIPTLLKDETRSGNLIRGKVFQFRARYYYDNGEMSAPGPVSIIALDKQLTGFDMLKTRKNYVLLDYQDNDSLVTASYRSVIKKVELLMREGNNGKWQSIVILDKYELSGTYRFYNDGQYFSIADSEANTLYDSVPIVVHGGQEIGNNRLFYADFEEGRDEVPVDMQVSIDFHEASQPKTWTLRMKVRSINFFDSAVAGPIKVGDTWFFGKAANQDNLGVYNQFLPSEGFIAYLAGTNLFGISEHSDGNPEGELLIRNIVPGSYSLRAASHKCDRGGTHGPMYDLNDVTLSWQKTSTYIKKIAGVDHNVNGKTSEYIFHLDEPTTSGQILDIGDLEIWDLSMINDVTVPVTTPPKAVVSGYLVDDGGTADVDAMKSAARMEKHLVDVAGSFFSISNIVTDHNGFFWAQVAIPTGSLANNLRFGATGINSTTLLTVGNNFFTGDIGGDADLGTSNAQPCMNFWIGVVLPNRSAAYSTGHATFIDGTVLDTTGQPVEGELAIVGMNSRWEETDGNGEYSILVYPDVWRAANDIDAYIFTRNGQNGLAIFNVDMDIFTRTNPYIMDDDTVDLTAYIASTLKRGGGYQIGVVYMCEGNRSTAVCANQQTKFYLPFITEDLNKTFPNQYPAGTFIHGQPEITWKIYHRPPTWATHYAIVRTKNAYYNRYLQVCISSAEYVVRYDLDTEEFITTDYQNNTAKQIALDIKTLQYFEEDNNGSLIGYEFQEGDRVRFILDDQGDYYDTFFDFEIKGSVGQKIIIDNLNSLPELKQGTLIEIYTPKAAIEEPIFYEVGEVYDIADLDGVRYHRGATQDQSTDYLQPAIGILQRGDTYYRQRTMRTIDETPDTPVETEFQYYIEDGAVSDFFDSTASDIGRVNKIDKTFGRKRFYDFLRFGDPYVSGAGINNICTFQQGNYKQLKINQPIRGLRMMNYVMMAIHEHAHTAVYIESQVINTKDNEQIISVSSDVIGNIDPMEDRIGTVDPGSVTRFGSRVYSFDREGVVTRYSNNGLTRISNYFMRTYFKGIAEILNDPLREHVEVISTFWEDAGEYLLTIKYRTQGFDTQFGFTVAFYEEQNAWTTFYPFIPESYCTSGTGIVSFKDGKLYEHNKGISYGRFYGTYYKQKFTPVFAPFPEGVVLFQSMDMRSNKKWNIPVIITSPSEDQANGQRSELLADDFETKEGVHSASFFMDKTTPNFDDPYEAMIDGEPLRGQWIELQMENSETFIVVLNSVEVKAKQSYLVNQ
jgi:hypothetical protein